MSASQIDADEEFLSELYDDYHYQIPKFQRPFSWTEGDLKTSLMIFPLTLRIEDRQNNCN